MYKMNWVDILMLVIVGWSVWRGLVTGLVKGLAGLVGIFLGFLTAFKYSGPLTEYINNHWQLAEKIKDLLPVNPSSWMNSVVQPELTQELKLPEGIVNLDLYGQQALSVIDSLKSSFAQGLLEVVAFILIFMIVSHLIYFLGDLLSRTSRLILLGPVDRLGGLALGLVRGLIIIFILVSVVAPLQAPASVFFSGQHENWLVNSIQHSAGFSVCSKILYNLHGNFPGLPL